mgnify:FL=1
MRNFTIAAILFLAVNSFVLSSPGDTTWLTAYDQDYHNWATVNYTSVTFPDTSNHYEKILMKYTIGCPAAGCDPWDRLGWVKLYTDTATGEGYEIARIVTPYNIVGGGYPGTCTFWIDVTDYMPLFHDTQILGNYIESWIGGSRGWLSTIKFAFIEGDLYYKPFKVVNLWQDHYVVYGDTANPHEDHLQPMNISIDGETAMVKARMITTGHGQGNTNNAAEFSSKYHSFLVNTDSVVHNLWRTDCSVNPCSPQGGTWTYSRAGWCPGASVIPWDNDVTSLITPGGFAVVDYNIQPYENFCRPTNPNCVSGVTCPDCNYNYNGHTEPAWNVEGQLIFYRLNPMIGINNNQSSLPKAFKLEQNYPNPFNPVTKIKYELNRYSHITLKVFSADGSEIAVLVDSEMKNGIYEAEWDAKDQPSGVYFYKLSADGYTETKKMVLIK